MPGDLGKSSVFGKFLPLNLTQKNEWFKVFLLFLNIFFIVASYYVVKSIRGALLIQKLGADSLPYVWTLSVFTLIAFVSVYSKIIDRFSRPVVVTVTSLFFVLSLGCIQFYLRTGAAWFTILFYVWSDVFSVVMVEQFWSFVNDVYEPKDAKRYYSIIGCGGILGGATGGGLVAWILPMVGTINMSFVCMGIIVLVIGSFWMVENSLKQGIAPKSLKTKKEMEKGHVLAGFKLIGANRYLLLIALTLVLTQIVSTLIDYQFNKIVETTITGLDAKGVFFGNFYMALNGVSLAVMLFVALPMHRVLGAFAGMLVLPLVNLLGVALFLVFPAAAIMIGVKLLDKSLNYSINRSSKEQLYLRTSREEKYKAKAVIDMFGYRSSKIFASALIIPLVALWGSVLINYLIAGFIVVLFVVLNRIRIELSTPEPVLVSMHTQIATGNAGSVVGLSPAHSAAVFSSINYSPLSVRHTVTSGGPDNSVATFHHPGRTQTRADSSWRSLSYLDLI